jgi:O-antigen/teichoic acid export membrane protein
MEIKQYFEQIVALANSKTSKFLTAILSTNVLISLMGFLGTILVLRKVDIQVIGVIYPLISVLHLCNQLGDLGLNNTFIKLAATHYKTQKTRSIQLYKSTLTAKLVLSFVLLTSGIIFHQRLSLLLFDSADYGVEILIVIAFGTLNILASVVMSFLRIEEKIFAYNISTFIPALLKFCALIFLLYKGLLYFDYVLGSFLIVPVFTFVLAFGFSDKSFFTSKNNFKSDLIEIFGHSKWILISIIAVAGIGQADVFMTRSIAGSAELANLIAGSRLSGILLVFGSSLTAILLPKVSSMNKKSELNFLVRKSIFVLLPSISVLGLLGTLLAPFIINIMLGAKYISAISVFQIFLIGFCFDLFITPISLVLYKLNLEKSLAVINSIQFIANVAGNSILIPQFGAEGAAMVSVSVRLFAVIVIIYLLNKNDVLFHKK